MTRFEGSSITQASADMRLATNRDENAADDGHASRRPAIQHRQACRKPDTTGTPLPRIPGKPTMAERIRPQLTDIFNDQLRANDLFAVDLPIDDAEELITDLGLDSASFALGRVACEEEFGIALELRDLMECVTFGDVVRLVCDALHDESIPATSSAGIDE